MAPGSAVHLRADSPAAEDLERLIRDSERRLQEEFLLLVCQMEGKGFPAADCNEVLAERYALFALNLGSTGQFLLCDFDVQDNVWTILAFTTGSNITDELYQEAAKAHGLSNPERDNDVQRYMR